MKVILLLSVLGLLALFAELFRFKKILYPIILIGLAGAIALAISYWFFDDGVMTPYFTGMVVWPLFRFVFCYYIVHRFFMVYNVEGVF